MTASLLLRHWITRLLAPDRLIREKYEHFKALLDSDARALDLIADLEPPVYGYDPADMARIRFLAAEFLEAVRDMTSSLYGMNPHGYTNLPAALDRIAGDISGLVAPQQLDSSPPYVLTLDAAADHPGRVGGKALNLAVARRNQIPTPPGFVITASAFARYLQDNDLEGEIEKRFKDVSLTNHDAIV
ncbi:MAG: PEP/pyruvate-binding domain-containing protein, partial [Desulfomicrobium sp.]|nr:PEP/pyruvate-binding domain-containing protein [Desulfomicrobium sp.]